MNTAAPKRNQTEENHHETDATNINNYEAPQPNVEPTFMRMNHMPTPMRESPEDLRAGRPGPADTRQYEHLNTNIRTPDSDDQTDRDYDEHDGARTSMLETWCTMD